MVRNAREWLNKNSAVVTIAAVVLLVVSLGIIIMTLRPKRYKPRIVDVYYFDLGANRTFVAKSNEIPPVEGPSGSQAGGPPMGVRAYLFACGDCPSNMVDMTPQDLFNQKVFIGWLEMYTPDAKERMEAMQRGEYKPESPEGPDGAMVPEMYDFWEQGHLISTLADSIEQMQWVPANSEPGFQIMQNLQDVCGDDATPKPCFPGRD